MPTRPRLTLLAVLLIACFPWQTTAGIEIHVSPDGSDEAAGTASAPFRSITRAQQAVRERLGEPLAEDVVVQIHSGIYFLERPLVFGPQDGGTVDHAVIYAACPGEKPVISAGRPLTGFTRTAANEWTLQLPAVETGQWSFRQLFMDGKRQLRARFPNPPEVLRITETSDDVTQITFDQAVQAADSLGHEAEVVVMQNWCITRTKIASAGGNSITATNPVGWIGHGAGRNGTWTIASPGKAAFLEHARAFVDQPGEWYLDRSAGRLTYRSADGEDPEAHEFIASCLPKVLVVSGRRDNPVRNLHFRGLTFAHAEWPLPDFGYVGIQAGHHGTNTNERVYVLPAAVELTHAHDCSLQACRVLHTGASGIGLGAGCRGNRIERCEIADVAGNGIMVGLRSKLELAGRRGGARLVAEWTNPQDIPRDNVISNCHVHRAGAVYSGCVGIYDGYCRNTRIAHNLVNHLPYTGISVGFRWDTQPTPQRGCQVEHNHVHDVMTLLADGGAIYTLGYQPGTVLRGNLLHDVHRSRYAHGGAPNNGIFFDQGSKDYLVEHNIIYNTSGEAIRFNQCKREDHTWKDNSFGVTPDATDFPQEIAVQAGPRKPDRK